MEITGCISSTSYIEHPYYSYCVFETGLRIRLQMVMQIISLLFLLLLLIIFNFIYYFYIILYFYIINFLIIIVYLYVLVLTLWLASVLLSLHINKHELIWIIIIIIIIIQFLDSVFQTMETKIVITGKLEFFFSIKLSTKGTWRTLRYISHKAWNWWRKCDLKRIGKQ
jgi:hypothetical protein